MNIPQCKKVLMTGGQREEMMKGAGVRQKQKLVVVCKKCEFAPEGVAYETQPADAITDVKKMVDWCKANIKQPGEYGLIREVPVKIDVHVHETLGFKVSQ
jgi:predicted nucleic-acid-binding Zn-ribbon protein